MNNSSQYTFPIFISSTDYNLKDLRAELSRYLTELGYKPILSSSSGFPDNSPNLEPWESCLKVLDHSFVIVLIIDGRYGQKFNWPNYKNIFNGNQYSPTHGEYIYAHSIKKRMLVFIRKEIMAFYSIFREAKKNNNDPKKLRQSIESLLPDYIDFEVFEFINAVKTIKPIPWINEFEDITLIKQEIQMKMINELAEIFMIQNKNLDTIVDAFDKIMDSIDPEKRDEILNELNSTKEHTKAKEELVREKEALEKAKKEIKNTRSKQKTDKKKNEKKIEILNKKISQMEDQIKDYENKHNIFSYKGGKMQFHTLTSPGLANYPFDTGSGILPTAEFVNHHNSINNIISIDKTCNKCGKEQITDLSMPAFSSIRDTFRFCPSCSKDYCEKCWPITSIHCPNCSSI